MDSNNIMLRKVLRMHLLEPLYCSMENQHGDTCIEILLHHYLKLTALLFQIIWVLVKVKHLCTASIVLLSIQRI